MNYEGATATLLGEPHKGMRAMFTMMNAARLSVGLQGLGVSELAHQNAVAYAKERLQGRALKGAATPDDPADPIIVHPDVRPHADDDARLQRRGAGAGAVDGAPARPRAQAPRRRSAPRRRGLRRPLDAGGQGLPHRHRLRVRQPRRAMFRRPRLHPRDRHGAAGARRPHHAALRGHQRHPGARPGGPQDAGPLRPRAAPGSSTPSPSSSKPTPPSPRSRSMCRRSPSPSPGCNRRAPGSAKKASPIPTRPRPAPRTISRCSAW